MLFDKSIQSSYYNCILTLQKPSHQEQAVAGALIQQHFKYLSTTHHAPMYTHTHAHSHTHTHTHTGTRTCTHTHTPPQTLRTHVHGHAHIHTHQHGHVCFVHTTAHLLCPQCQKTDRASSTKHLYQPSLIAHA